MTDRVVVAAASGEPVDRLCAALAAQDLQAIHTTSVRETLLEFDGKDVVGILASPTLPEGDWIDIFERAQSMSPDILRVFLCDPGDTTALNRAQEIGVDRTFVLDVDAASTVAELVREDLDAHDLAADRQRERAFSGAFLAGISALTTASDPSTALSVLPERLVSTGAVSVAWTSRYDSETKTFTPESAAGIDPGSLRPLPAAEVNVENDDPIRIDEGDPRRVTVVFQTDGAVHGALHLYVAPPGLAGPERRLLASAGRAIGRVLGGADTSPTGPEVTDPGQSAKAVSTRSASAANTFPTHPSDRTPIEVYSEVVAHELRNHLDVAQSYLRIGADVSGNEDLERVDAALSRIEAVIKEAEAVAGYAVRDMDRESIDLIAAAERVWDRLNAETADLHLTDPGTIRAHPAMFDLLLENLFRNAVTHAGAEVTVTVGSLPDGFFIEDDGPGIPKEDRDVIFDWGYPSRSDRNGVGLAIVKRIVEAHGWTVDIEDGSSGGARFMVRTEN